MDADRAPTRSGAEVRQAAAAFARPITGHGVLQLLTSFGPFIAGSSLIVGALHDLGLLSAVT